MKFVLPSRFRLRREATTTGLVTSRLYDQRSFYRAFEQDLRAAKQEVIIESPFVSNSRATRLLPLLAHLRKRGIHIVINTRHPDEHDNKARRDAINIVIALQEMGVKVLYTGALHRKIAIIDRSIVYEGSLNILSQIDSCEIMRRIQSRELASELYRFLNIGQ